MNLKHPFQLQKYLSSIMKIIYFLTLGQTNQIMLNRCGLTSKNSLISWL
jgi:hypothetical protein